MGEGGALRATDEVYFCLIPVGYIRKRFCCIQDEYLLLQIYGLYADMAIAIAHLIHRWSGPPVSLRLGHDSVLTAIQAVIHCLVGASLPTGEG